MNHYDCLKVTPDAPTEVIRAAYRALAGKLHPDRQGSAGGRDNETHDQMAALNTAYEVLVDPGLRAEYDAALIAKAIAIEGGDRPHAQQAEEPEQETGFSETRVDIDWLTPKVLGTKTRWPPSRRMVIVGSSVLGFLVLFALWVIWQVVTGHQMDRALSDQYAVRPAQPESSENTVVVDMGSDVAAARLARAVQKPPAQPAPQQAPLAVESPTALPSAASAAETETMPLPDHTPTVAELSRMSDEQLLAVLPTLGEVQPVRGSFARPAYHHPLDGKPLNLRTEKHLVDPLAPEEPGKAD